MSYDILEARIEFNAGLLERVTVLVNCTGTNNPHTKPFSDVRAIYATTKPRGGYTHLLPTAKITNQLLQEVAAAGMETMDRDTIFPNWQNKYQRNG